MDSPVIDPQIEANGRPTPPPTKSQITSEFKRKAAHLALLTLILFLVAVGAYFFFQTQSLKQQLSVTPTPYPTETKPTLSPTVPPAKESDPTNDATITWSTYQNTKYHYSIKYPNTLKVGETVMDRGQLETTDAIRIYDPQQKEPLFSHHLVIQISPNSSTNLEAQARNHFNSIATKAVPESDRQASATYLNFTVENNQIEQPFTATQLTGFNAYTYTITGSFVDVGPESYLTPPQSHMYYWIKHDQDTVQIYLTNTPEMNQILSTLKFTQ